MFESLAKIVAIALSIGALLTLILSLMQLIKSIVFMYRTISSIDKKAYTDGAFLFIPLLFIIGKSGKTYSEEYRQLFIMSAKWFVLYFLSAVIMLSLAGGIRHMFQGS